MSPNSFGKLRELANQISGLARTAGTKNVQRRIVNAAQTLGSVAVPMLVRRFCDDPATRPVCQAALLAIADITLGDRDKVVAELRKSLRNSSTDEGRVATLGLLHKLGSNDAGAQFADPVQVQRDAARALATQLTTPAEIARAAGLMVAQLPIAELLAMVELVVADAPDAGGWLTDELLVRQDVDAVTRAELRRIAAAVRVAPQPVPGQAHDSELRALVHPSGAAVVVVEAAPAMMGKQLSVRRAMAFLIDAQGILVDATYQEPAAPGATAEWLRGLQADGYLESELERVAARSLVTLAARRALTNNLGLPPAYYVGRDLLQLGNAHLGGRAAHEVDNTWSVAAGYGVDLLAAGDVAAAHDLLRRCITRDPVQAAANADVAVAYGMSCLAMQQFADATHWLAVASAADPSNADHAWNWACAAERCQDLGTTHRALAQYCMRAERTAISPSTAQRLELARAMLATLRAPEVAQTRQPRTARRKSRRSEKPATPAT